MEIMLKSIATAHSESTGKRWNKAGYNTYYIVPDKIDFFGYYYKEIFRLKIEIFIFVKNIVLPKNWFVVKSNFWEFPKQHTEK